MTSESDDNPLEQLVELLVYAPIGLLYEYPDVLPRLIKRGKSQVQLAKFAGRLVIKQQRSKAQSGDQTPSAATGSFDPEALSGTIARIITDVGSMIGLAPQQMSSSAEEDPASQSAKVVAETKAPTGSPSRSEKLPIANYDKLTAKEVIFVLEDLSVSQLRRVQRFEEANRNRKTVLAKIDRLLS